jgi:hypothetical protein
MPKRQFTTEQIINKLREVELEVGRGMSLPGGRGGASRCPCPQGSFPLPCQDNHGSPSGKKLVEPNQSAPGRENAHGGHLTEALRHQTL